MIVKDRPNKPARTGIVVSLMEKTQHRNCIKVRVDGLKYPIVFARWFVELEAAHGPS
jgi:hypothetical protein